MVDNVVPVLESLDVKDNKKVRENGQSINANISETKKLAGIGKMQNHLFSIIYMKKNFMH